MRALLLVLTIGCAGPPDDAPDASEGMADGGLLKSPDSPTDAGPDALIYCVCPQTGQQIECGNQTAFELKDNLPPDCLDCTVITDDCHFVDAGPGLAGWGFCPVDAGS